MAGAAQVKEEACFIVMMETPLHTTSSTSKRKTMTTTEEKSLEQEAIWGRILSYIT